MASSGPVTAEAAPAAAPRPGATPVRSLPTAALASPEWAASSQEPMLIGEVGLATRSMCRNRSGRPSSAMRNPVPPMAAAAAVTRPARASPRRPVAAAAAPMTADAPDRPPRYR